MMCTVHTVVGKKARLRTKRRQTIKKIKPIALSIVELCLVVVGCKANWIGYFG